MMNLSFGLFRSITFQSFVFHYITNKPNRTTHAWRCNVEWRMRSGLFLSFLLIRFISCFHSFRFSITNEPNKRKRENKPNKPDNRGKAIGIERKEPPRGDTWAVRLSEWLVSVLLFLSLRFVYNGMKWSVKRTE